MAIFNVAVGSKTAFPGKVNLVVAQDLDIPKSFWYLWHEVMEECCHHHPIWSDVFMNTLNDPSSSEIMRFNLASVWSINMVVGSYCFPRYVAALAARSEQDGVRYGLLENAWDEAGGVHHTSRSHFWLAVRLAQLLGFSEAEIERIHPLECAQKYTNEHYYHCAAGEFGFALGMICLIEEFTTQEFTSIFKAFLQSCGHGLSIEPTDFILKGGAEYFTANIADDERHRLEMPRLVAIWLHSNGVTLEDQDAVRHSIESVREGILYSVGLRQQFFSGIYNFVKSGGKPKDLLM